METISTTSMPRLNRQITLPDGRRLGYDEYGRPDGAAIIYCHGSPSSRLEWQIFGSQDLADRLGLRMIVPDRPGMGLSDFQPGRRIIDWPDDVAALAGQLGIDRFSVLSYSVGGPYAAACAWKIPQRLESAGMVSSIAPFDIPGMTADINPASLQFLTLARDRPWLNRLMMRMMGITVRYAPNRMINQAASVLPRADQAVMKQPQAQRAFLTMIEEAVRSGTRGAQWDGALGVSPWGFDLRDIPMEVHIWHGEVDRNAPLAMGRYLADAIPNSDFHFFPGEGHISLFYRHIEEILGVIAC